MTDRTADPTTKDKTAGQTDAAQPIAESLSKRSRTAENMLGPMALTKTPRHSPNWQSLISV